MRSLPKPSINFKGLYTECVNGKREPVRTDLIDCLPRLLILNRSYDSHAVAKKLFQLPIVPITEINQTNKAEIRDLYEERLVPPRSVGRNVYDKLLAAAKGKCPFCNHSTASTLDHFLAKEIAQFPELSLSPLNLVPACKDCNHKKGNVRTVSEGTQLIHPYYEDLDQILWLKAETKYSSKNEISVVYSVSPTIGNAVLKARINFQATQLQLFQLYSQEAAHEINSIYDGLHEKVFKTAGSSGVKRQCEEMVELRAKPFKNSWQSALYKALASCGKFHTMDWVL